MADSGLRAGIRFSLFVEDWCYNNMSVEVGSVAGRDGVSSADVSGDKNSGNVMSKITDKYEELFSFLEGRGSHCYRDACMPGNMATVFELSVSDAEQFMGLYNGALVNSAKSVDRAEFPFYCVRGSSDWKEGPYDRNFLGFADSEGFYSPGDKCHVNCARYVTFSRAFVCIEHGKPYWDDTKDSRYMTYVVCMSKPDPA